MSKQTQSFPKILKRGIYGRCPNCGDGALFKSYLKQVEACAQCGEKFGHIRADDAPAWLTILLAGHVVAPFLLGVVPNLDWPEWVILLVIMSYAFLLSLAILPSAKGFFISVIWRSGAIGSEK